MKIEVEKFERDGISYRRDSIPEGWVEVEVYRPHSCPWDYYGNKHLNEYAYLLAKNGIECVKLITRQETVSPIGSGPGGRVRLGDSTLPGLYRIAVAQQDEEKATKVILDYQQALHDWCWKNRPKPF